MHLKLLFTILVPVGLTSLLVACSESSSSSVAPSEPSEPTVQVIATNLDSPRGMAFGPDGLLYIAEAGRGPTVYDATLPAIPSPSSPTAQLQFGATGSIARLDVDSGAFQRVLTGLPSVGVPDDPIFGEDAGTDGLGPTDITFDESGQAYFTVGLGSDPANRDVFDIPEFAGLPNQLGSLATADVVNGGSYRVITDLAVFEAANNPDGSDVVSNPYSLTVVDNTVHLLDAGANTLLQTDRSGAGLALTTVFDDIRIVPNPGIPGPPPEIPMQQVPTAVVSDLSGNLLVSEYTGFPFPAGLARIFRVNGSTASVFLEGFTNMTDLAVDRDGNIWVLEYDSDSVVAGEPFGSLIRVNASGERTTIVGNLTNPTGVAVGPDGRVYIANQGFEVGVGEILQVSF